MTRSPCCARSATASRTCRARWWWPRPTRTPGACRRRRSRRSCCRAWRARRAPGSACSTRRSRTAAACWSGSRPTRSRCWWPTPMPRAFSWRWPAPCARRICRWYATPEPTSPVCARPPAAMAGARHRSRRRASVPWSRRAPLCRRARLAEPGDVEPVGDLARAAVARGGGNGVAPGVGGVGGPLQEVVEDVCGGLGLDQATQAEADVPALVALDAIHPLAHPGQGAVGQIVEQRVLPGIEDDSLEQHVVEADAFAQPRAPRGELCGHRRQPLL